MFLLQKIKTMEKLIHWSKIWDMMQRTDTHGEPIPFQLAYVKLSTGEIREYDRCTLTSVHTNGTTVNVLPDGEFRPRKIRKVSIIEFNHAKVYL
jgi:hypothetical protein